MSAWLALRFSPWLNILVSSTYHIEQSTPVGLRLQSSSRAGESGIFRHPIPHGFHGVSIHNRHVIVPRLTFAEYHNTPWSTEELVLERGKHLVLMYNYTRMEHNGTIMTRYTKRETVPYWRSIINYDRAPGNVKSLLRLRKRGYTVRPTPPEAGKHEQFEDDQNDLRGPQFKQPKQFMSWNWNRKAGSTTPTIIPLCYVTKNTHDLLDKYFKLAIQEWHDVLGAKRGVEFRLYQVDEHNVCATPINAGSDADSDDSYVYADKCWDNNHVQIRWSSPKMDRGTYTTVVGFNWGGEAADMFIETHPYLSDASGYSGSDEVITANVVHELGHILGLHHEHQRPQARNEIDFDYVQLSGYAEAMDQLDDYNEDHNHNQMGSTITMEELTNDAGLAEKLVGAGIFKGTKFDMVDQYATYYSEAHNADNERTDDWVELGAHIDFDSVMMYESIPEVLKVDGSLEPLMRKKGSTGTEGMWGINLHPSVGDVAAVKSLYPDLA
ncbi:hypothetical protein EG328_009902 [Venturia inaequalis]|uniref:Peptidase metallopeptidase domain-containing protein n=1 Tax=Venturia inaequalis TaxID=5025 RepID=A0A8H3U992_VENIN|nr:hypothetical protein EG328_009902 [Venturia inaequalis]